MEQDDTKLWVKVSPWFLQQLYEKAEAAERVLGFYDLHTDRTKTEIRIKIADFIGHAKGAKFLLEHNDRV